MKRGRGTFAAATVGWARWPRISPGPWGFWWWCRASSLGTRPVPWLKMNFGTTGGESARKRRKRFDPLHDLQWLGQCLGRQRTPRDVVAWHSSQAARPEQAAEHIFRVRGYGSTRSRGWLSVPAVPRAVCGVRRPGPPAIWLPILERPLECADRAARKSDHSWQVVPSSLGRLPFCRTGREGFSQFDSFTMDPFGGNRGHVRRLAIGETLQLHRARGGFVSRSCSAVRQDRARGLHRLHLEVPRGILPQKWRSSGAVASRLLRYRHQPFRRLG